MKCFTCTKLTHDYKKDKRICAACREVYKIDLVHVVLERDPIYLSESNRYKHGRKPKLTATEMSDIKSIYENPPGNKKISMEEIAREYNVSAGTISRIIHDKYRLPF